MIYAIEPRGDGLYALCKLGSWVDLGELGHFATVTCQERVQPEKPSAIGNSVAGPITTPQLHKQNKKRRLAIEEIQSLVKKRPRLQSVASICEQSQDQPSTTPPTQVTDALPNESHKPEEQPPTIPPPTSVPAQAVAVEDSLSQPGAEEIFDNIKSQYTDILYHSMVSWSIGFIMSTLLTCSRDHWHTSQRGRSLVLEQLSILIVTQL
jgi:DNA replication regulator SLD3